MSKPRFASIRACRAWRKHWRPFLLGMLIAFTVTVSVVLYIYGSEHSERAGLAIGGTLAGMLIIAFFVCRR